MSKETDVPAIRMCCPHCEEQVNMEEPRAWTIPGGIALTSDECSAHLRCLVNALRQRAPAPTRPTPERQPTPKQLEDMIRPFSALSADLIKVAAECWSKMEDATIPF